VPAKGTDLWNGERLKTARRLKNWSLRELARSADISPTNVSAYEKNEKIPKMSTLQKLAAALDIPTSELLRPAAEIAGEDLLLPLDQETVFEPAQVRIRPTSEALLITVQSRRSKRA
jgi:transcriptional regulator with XRE-family HTH domain